jgi:hypothetical protein
VSAAFPGGNLTVFVAQFEMPYVRENQGHRWRDWLDNDAVRQILENAAENIAWAWGVDQEYPKSYPVNTGQLLYEIRTRIEESLKPKKPLPIPKRSKGIRPRPPRSFSELIADRAIQVVYEDQNSGTYKDALVLASRGDRPTFRKIVRAIESVYVMDQVGPDALPRPKTQFLHRNILQIAKVSGLNDQKDEGILEFLDDLCPCGTKHQLDAIRKLRERLG